MNAAIPIPVVVMKSNTVDNEPVAVMKSNTVDNQPAVVVTAGQSTDPVNIVGTLPKTLQEKGRQLLARLSKVEWNERGELMHEGVAIPGSNAVDLVHDLLRNRKTATDPLGWHQFAKQMRSANIPMELVGNEARRKHMQKATPTKRIRKSNIDIPAGWEPYWSKYSLCRYDSPTVFNFRRRHYRHHLHRRRIFTSTSADGTLVSGWCSSSSSSSMGRSTLHQQYYDQKRVGSYAGVAALQRVVPAEDGCRSRMRTRFTNRWDVVSNAAASWWEVRTNNGRPISLTCRVWNRSTTKSLSCWPWSTCFLNGPGAFRWRASRRQRWWRPLDSC